VELVRSATARTEAPILIPYWNELSGRRDYHPPVSRHAFNPPRDRRRWPWLLFGVGLLLGLGLVIGGLR
jgi:hypothetical protein